MLQSDDLILAEKSPMSALKLLLVEPGVHRTIELHYIVAQCFEYPSYDTVPANVQLDPDCLSVFRDHCQIVNHRTPFFEVDTVEYLLKVSFRQWLIELRFVNLFYVVPRMR